MPTVRYSIDSRGAEQGAQRFSNAIDRVVNDARRAAQAIEQLDRVTRSIGQASAGAVPGLARVTQASQQMQRSVQGAAQHATGFAVTMRNLGSASVLAFGPLSGVGARITAVGAAAQRSTLALGAGVAAVTGIGVALATSIRAAAEFEAGMLRVAKVTGDSGAALARMSENTLRLSSTLGVPATELAKIEQGAAQLGIRGSQNLAAFAEQVAMLTRTSDLGAEQATQSIARLLNITGEGAGNVAGMAAALTELGNKSAASESQILSMSLELGRGTAAFDVSSQQLLSLGAALAEVGEKSERSATAVSQVFIAITDAASGGDNLEKFADVLGVTAEEFQRLAQQDIGGVFVRIMEVLARQGPEAVATLRELEIGSSRNTKVLLSLAEVLDRYQRNLGLVADQYRNPLAALQEFERMNDSVSRQVEIAGTQLTNMATIVGSAFLPPLSEVLQSLNAFLLLLQDIEPPAGQAGNAVRLLATGVQLLGDAISVATDGLPTFLSYLAGPQIGTAIALINTLRGAYASLSPPSQAEFFPDADENVKVLTASIEQLTGAMNTSSVASFAAAFPPLASSIDGIADAATNASSSLDQLGRAVSGALADLQKQIDLKKLELAEGKAAAETQKIINDLQTKGGQEAAQVSDEQRAAIRALVQENENLDDQLRNVGRSNKDVAKSADEAARAYETFEEGLADVIRDLENQLALEGLDEGQRSVVELTQKIEDLRVEAVRGGADEAAAREAANATLAEAIPLQQRLNAEKAQEYRQGVLDDLREQVELRRIETTEGRAAAETQRIINEAKRQGVEITDEFVAGVRESTAALEEFESQSTVVADAFEDFISGIARGTQELNLDGIADAFKAAFAASVKEKLKFDEIFKGNLFDLVGFAADLFSGGGIDIGGLFSFGGSGGSGGGLLGLLSGGGSGGLLGLLGAGALYAPALLSGAGGTFAARGDFATGAGLAVGSRFGAAGLNYLLTSTDAGIKVLGAVESLLGTANTASGLDLLGSMGNLTDPSMWANLGLGLAIRAGGGAIAGAVGSSSHHTAEGQMVTDITSTVIEIVGNVLAMGLPIGSVFAAINDIIDPFIHELFGLFQPPTEGTMRRMGGESALTRLPTFADLEESLGDITRSNYRLRDNPNLASQRERFDPETLEEIGGFAGIFSQLVFGGDEAGSMAGVVQEWENILVDFFSRMDGDSEELGLAVRQNLAQAFKEMRLDAADAMAVVNDLAENLLSQGDPTYFGEAVSNVTNLGEAIRGTASIFESELPAGVHIAALALETMSKDGETFFGDLDREGRETLLNLSKDAENFDKIVAHLFEQGYEIDTEEFERRLEAITASAEQVGQSIGSIFDAGSAEAAIQQMLQSLKGTIREQLGGGFLEQLFDKTQIAGVFEPVFDVLNRLDEFDLTTSGGMQQFRSEIIPAILQGKANLQEYLPVLREMLKNWREIEKVIDEAFEPTAAEEMVATVTQAFEGIGSIFSTGIQAGLAVLADGGSYQDALDTFNNVVGQGIETTLKQAIFNALVNSVVIRPLIDKYAPAFSFIAAAGLEHGFDDPRVRSAWLATMEQFGSDVEAFGPLIFDAQLELIGQENAAKKFFVKLEVVAEAANQKIAQGMYTLLRESIDIAMEDGVAAGQENFAENIGEVVYNTLLDAIVQAFIDAAIVQGLLGDSIAEGAALYAAAYSPEGPGGALVTEEEQRQIDIWRASFRDLYRIATEAATDLANDLIQDIVENDPRESTDPNIRKRRIAQGDVDPFDLNGGRSGRRFPGSGLDFPESDYDSGARRRVIEEQEDLADRTMAATNALGDFSTAVRQAISALADLSGVADEGEPKKTGRKFPGAAGGGMFGPGETFIVGEIGPELVVNGPGGIASVIPLDHATASALLEGGMPGYARGFPWERGGAGGGKTGTGKGPGSGWGLGGSFIGPEDTRHPDNRERPGDGASADEVLVKLQIEAQLEEFFRSGDFASFTEQFEQQVNQAVADGVMSALLESGPLATAIEKFNQGLTTEIEKAWADGSLSDEEIARIKARIKELGGPIRDIIDALGPEMAALFEDLGLAESVASDLRSGLESAVRDFATTGSVTDLHESIRTAFYDAAVSGIVSALLAEGPIADAIETAGTSFRDAIDDAMEDGIVTDEEAAQLTALGEQLGSDVQSAITGLDPAIAGFFDGLRDRAAEAAATVNQLLGNALRGAINDPKNLNYGTFSKSLRQQIYQSVAGGLIDAFIESAVIQGALAPMLGVITSIFDQIGKKQLTIAEANGAIAEQIALINGVLLDPTFKAAIDTLLDGVRGIGEQLNAFPDAAADTAAAAGAVSDAVTQAEEDVCAGKCGLKQETIDLGNTILDAAGRAGYMTDEVWRAIERNAPARDAWADIPDTQSDRNGTYGTEDWWAYQHPFERRFRRDRRRVARGLPSQFPGYAEGGIVMEPTLGWIAEAGRPEAVIPLDRISEGGETVDAIRELREELRELRRENRELREAIEARPIMLEAKVGEAKAIDILYKLKRTARDSGTEL